MGVEIQTITPGDGNVSLFVILKNKFHSEMLKMNFGRFEQLFGGCLDRRHCLSHRTLLLHTGEMKKCEMRFQSKVWIIDLDLSKQITKAVLAESLESPT